MSQSPAVVVQNAIAQLAGLAAAKVAAAPNKTITLSGDASGSGTSGITVTLDTVNSNVGTFQGITVNGKGLVTAAVAAATKAKLQTTQIATSVPLTTASTSATVMGLATTAISGSGNTTIITPTATGNIFVSVTFLGQLATGTDFGEAQIVHGTGTPPNGGATPGGAATVGSSAAWGNTNAAGNVPYFTVTLQGIIIGATIGTALWFDLEWLNGVGARTVDAYNISACAFEI